MTSSLITPSVRYLGVDDNTIDLFEGQYIVPNGISYNSYLIDDDSIAIMDTVDARATKEWLLKLEAALNGRQPDYLIISHMEPDHAGSLAIAAEKYPQMKLVGTAKAFAMLEQFFQNSYQERGIAVKDNDTLSLGSHTLHFITAPMVHWPEVMFTYESAEKLLFSADAFGTFGALDAGEEWLCEARRYYCNIVGKYGAPVQTVLKKAAALDIAKICPLHGPVLTENLAYYIDKYSKWSSYTPEEDGVFIAYNSVYGNTRRAVEQFAGLLAQKGAAKVVLHDLAREDMAAAVESAFRYDKLVVASTTYDAAIFPCVEAYLNHLKSKGLQNRRFALIENGSWAPTAAKAMRGILETMKNNQICEHTVTIKSAATAETAAAMELLADELLG